MYIEIACEKQRKLYARADTIAENFMIIYNCPTAVEVQKKSDWLIE